MGIKSMGTTVSHKVDFFPVALGSREGSEVAEDNLLVDEFGGGEHVQRQVEGGSGSGALKGGGRLENGS